LDIFAQLNIWRIITVSGKRAQDVANETFAGSGHFLAILIGLGGLAFNIGNIAGAGLGLNVLTGWDLQLCVLISAIIGIGIFVFKEVGKALDTFTKILGFVMIAMIIYVCYVSNPPMIEAATRTILPLEIDALATVALVGGTVGGYITFAGAHRLLDAGISGVENINQVNRGATTGILITALIRFLLFLASLGVITAGANIDTKNPSASVFQSAAGEIGYKIFGVVMFCAAITSVVGAAYTSVSFLRSLHAKVEQNQRFIIIAFILLSTGIFLLVGQPVKVLVLAGILNGFILPVALGLVLLATNKKSVVGDYKHPLWMQICGWFVVVVMAALSFYTLVNESRKLFA
jgi:Mn2+/Fe2+ NRAMP family transporter